VISSACSAWMVRRAATFECRADRNMALTTRQDGGGASRARQATNLDL
jgi:hypothetical protein